jgi:hypothetical protein
MDELPTDALAFGVTHATAAAAPGSILGNKVAYPIEPAKLFECRCGSARLDVHSAGPARPAPEQRAY